MSLPFVPRLPTWNLTCVPYVFNPVTGTRTLGTGFLGQMYPPLRSSDNIGPSDAYLVYPKEVTALHDPAEYDYAGTDAIVFSWNGNTWGFLVEQLLPRWANFPNQHYLAVLRRMSAAELAAILTPTRPGGPLPPFPHEISVYHVVEEATGATGKGTSPCNFATRGWYLNLSQPQEEYVLFDFTFRFPKENFDIIDAKFAYPSDPQEWDVVAIEFPTDSGHYVYFKVVDVWPENLGTPHELLVGYCERANREQVDAWFVVPDPGESSIACAPDEILPNDTDVSTVTVTVKDSGGTPIPGRVVTISTPTGLGTLDAPVGVTDGSGEYSTTYHSAFEESITFEASVDGLGSPLGPSNTLDVVAAEPTSWDGPGGAIFGNGTCVDCAELDDTIVDLVSAGTGVWETATPFAWTCNGGNDVFWRLIYGYPWGAALQLIDDGTNLPLVTWNVDLTGWNGTDPVDFVLQGSPPADCDWPDPLTMTPTP